MVNVNSEGERVYIYIIIIKISSENNVSQLRLDWFKRIGCSCGSLRVQMVAISSSFKRYD